MERSEVEARRVALIQEIEAVFDGVSRKGGVSLHEATALDDYTDPKEARAKDTESRWQDVPEVVLYEHGQSIGFLDVIGFRYYLPAMLTWALNHLYDQPDSPRNAFDSNAYSSLLYKLGRRKEVGLKPSQFVVVAKFLKFMDELEQLEFSEYLNNEYLRVMGRPPTEAEIDEWTPHTCEEGRLLKRYWGQFLEPGLDRFPDLPPSREIPQEPRKDESRPQKNGPLRTRVAKIRTHSGNRNRL